VDFAHRTSTIAKQQFELCSYPVQVARRPAYAHSKARPRAGVVEEQGLRAVFTDCEIGSSVFIKITYRRAASFTINYQATQLTGHCFEMAMAIAAKQNATPGIAADRLRLHTEKVLSEKQIFVAITVEVTNANSKGRGELRFSRKDHGLKFSVSI
jgi:hypothetical protein